MAFSGFFRWLKPALTIFHVFISSVTTTRKPHILLPGRLMKTLVLLLDYRGQDKNIIRTWGSFVLSQKLTEANSDLRS